MVSDTFVLFLRENIRSGYSLEVPHLTKAFLINT